jgi:hypothetical protein
MMTYCRAEIDTAVYRGIKIGKITSGGQHGTAAYGNITPISGSSGS